MSVKKKRPAYREAMIKKHGSARAWREHMAELAAKGGKAKVPKGFSVTRKKMFELIDGDF